MISAFLAGHIRLGLCARGFGCRVTILRLLKVVRIDGHHLDRRSIVGIRRHEETSIVSFDQLPAQAEIVACTGRCFQIRRSRRISRCERSDDLLIGQRSSLAVFAAIRRASSLVS